MKSQDFKNKLTSIRLDLRKAIADEIRAILAVTGGDSFKIEDETLWDDMMESAYLTVIINASGEMTILRNEKVTGAGLANPAKREIIPNNVTMVLTEKDSEVYTDEIDSDTLGDVLAVLEEVRLRLEDGTFVADNGIVRTKER